MSVDDFLDTNVFVYLFDETAPGKRQIADGLVQRRAGRRLDAA